MIAGGGISGIEALGEILRRHRDDASLSVEVVEAGARLLPGLPAALDADLRRLCEPYAVKFRTATTIAGVSAKGVRLADGTRLRSELTLWTAGLAPPALLRESGLARPPQVWADVHQTLQSRHFDNTFVVGDAAQLPQAVGKQAYNAIDMGALAAANVARFLAGRTLKPFRPAPKPVVIAFGDLQTYLVAGRTVLASKVLAGAKEGGLSGVHVADGAGRRVDLVAGRDRPAVAELASAGRAAAVVLGRFQEAARPQGHQAAVDGPCAGQAMSPGAIVFGDDDFHIAVIGTQRSDPHRSAADQPRNGSTGTRPKPAGGLSELNARDRNFECDVPVRVTGAQPMHRGCGRAGRRAAGRRVNARPADRPQSPTAVRPAKRSRSPDRRLLY